MKNLLFVGTVAFVFTGCAASNGGGHVVGNSAIPPATAQKMAKAETCACGHVADEHEWSGQPKDCAVEGCGCIHFEWDGEAADG